jgi:hypothetical protein
MTFILNYADGIEQKLTYKKPCHYYCLPAQYLDNKANNKGKELAIKDSEYVHWVKNNQLQVKAIRLNIVARNEKSDLLFDDNFKIKFFHDEGEK